MHFIKDEEFIRGNPPMTKEEVRILSICKMNLQKNYKVLDVGAGTGSISIQCSKICSEGKVIAIEKDEDAIEIMQENKNKFNCTNLELIKGEALDVMNNIEDEFDAIFIGGSGGNIEDIISGYGNKLKENGVMVLNFITISNLYRAMEFLNKIGYKTECTQVAVSKLKGKSGMLIANNPIFILVANKK
ncbi:precorrin-6Y C5,15-methyltransferase (decarboxylating) subunit CbiT [Haloimpatiens lingqiaonensis]|uniref:precorrin-6Y C5,15-methyltransferase (decarboxylating) subunit CbiT n=1 Tax=Haloimpatiens lingqiaonensis TaxID=1380675 RepID=UPI0010FE8D4E|nr:precorrin-6Y C5,15-methyltransferase (decarboxylating) subunit CbiT [Haloimpatiens lingqiaonensis]